LSSSSSTTTTVHSTPLVPQPVQIRPTRIRRSHLPLRPVLQVGRPGARQGERDERELEDGGRQDPIEYGAQAGGDDQG
jgi:hypothetical protein